MNQQNGPPIARFSASAMFRAAGGMASDVRDLLMATFRTAPELSAIQMWKQRNMVPSQWQGALVYALVRGGARVFDLMERK